MEQKELQKKLGEFLRKRREELGMSRSRAAKAAGISSTYMRHIENGDNMPSTKILDKLAPVYGMSRREVLDAIGYFNEPAPNGSKLELVEAAFKLTMLDRDNEFIKKISSLVPLELSQEMKQVIIIAYEMISGKKLL